MDTGWPALRDGSTQPPRMILKQSRSLDPGLRRIPENVRQGPFPRDILDRASSVEEIRCSTGDFEIIIWEARTNPLALPDLGHSQLPFSASITIEFSSDSSRLGSWQGRRIEADHLDFATTRHPDLVRDSIWKITIELSPEAQLSLGIQEIVLSERGNYSFRNGTDFLSGDDLSCSSMLHVSSASDFLESLFKDSISE